MADEYEIHERTQPEQPTAVRGAVLAVAEIGPWLGETYSAIARVLDRHGAAPGGRPFARYRRIEGDRFQVEAGFPTEEALSIPGPPDEEDGVHASTLPGGPAAVTVHVGPYDAMEPAYEAVSRWIAQRGGEPTGAPWEIYESDPVVEPDPAAWRTEIVQPYRPA